MSIIDIKNTSVDVNTSIFGGRALLISRIALLISIMQFLILSAIAIVDINNDNNNSPYLHQQMDLLISANLILDIKNAQY